MEAETYDGSDAIRTQHFVRVHKYLDVGKWGRFLGRLGKKGSPFERKNFLPAWPSRRNTVLSDRISHYPDMRD